MRFHSSLAAANLVHVRLTENDKIDLTYKIKQNHNNNNDNSNNLHTSD